MTRILMITDGRFSDRIRVSNEARALVEAGHEVHVHALDSWCETASFESDGVRVTEHRLPKWCHWARVLNAEWPFYAWVVGRVVRSVVASVQPDVIHVHNLFVWTGARRAQKMAPQAKWVLDIAENLPEIMQEYDHVKRGIGRLLIRPKLWAKLQRRAIQEADHVVLVTQTAVDDYVSRLGLTPSKAIVCDNVPWDDHIGVDGAEELRARFDGAFVLFYFGDTSRRRGTDLAMEAMPEVVKHVPHAHLVIVGKNNREDVFLEAIRDQSPVGDRIHLEGFQPMSKLGAYLSIASVGLSPLVRNIHHDTTHANKLFQFMHGGLPLVVSDCTAQAALVESTGTGWVHPAGNAQALAEAVVQAAQNPEEAKSRGQRGKSAIADRFNWRVEIQKYLDSVCL
jgi:glycosyltransferase involved in cell wall biosynthesis